VKLSYYPGCTLKNHARNFEDSTRFALEQLGAEVEELERWNCCGTVYSLTADDLMRQVAPVRNLIRAKEANASQLMTGCSMCYNTLKRANERVRKNPEDLARLNAFMNEEPTDYAGDVDVVHILEVVKNTIGFETLKKRVKKPLKGLKVASYYGCMLVRPKQIAFDNVENPMALDQMVELLGGTPIDFSHKTVCCGAYQTVDKPDIVAEQTLSILSAARSSGAEAIIVSCPLCAFNLDHRQALTLKKHPEFLTMPVFYFTQLMSIAFGCDESVLRFDLHHIPPKPLLAEKQLL
jgi:heterodisulfide reductase subunit B